MLWSIKPSLRTYAPLETTSTGTTAGSSTGSGFSQEKAHTAKSDSNRMMVFGVFCFIVLQILREDTEKAKRNAIC